MNNNEPGENLRLLIEERKRGNRIEFIIASGLALMAIALLVIIIRHYVILGDTDLAATPLSVAVRAFY